MLVHLSIRHGHGEFRHNGGGGATTGDRFRLVPADQELTDYEGENAAMPVIGNFLRRIDSDDRAKLSSRAILPKEANGYIVSIGKPAREFVVDSLDVECLVPREAV